MAMLKFPISSVAVAKADDKADTEGAVYQSLEHTLDDMPIIAISLEAVSKRDDNHGNEGVTGQSQVRPPGADVRSLTLIR
jgi:hypothetical protein